MIYLINKRPVNVFKCLQAVLKTLIEALKRCGNKGLSKHCECAWWCSVWLLYSLLYKWTKPWCVSIRALEWGVWRWPTFTWVIHTIIGAKSFHGPVRDGKAWDQLAMAARLNCTNFESRRAGFFSGALSTWSASRTSNRVMFVIAWLQYPATHDFSKLFFIRSLSNDRVKPHEQLVSVSFTRYRASTPDLSTSWSRTTL